MVRWLPCTVYQIPRAFGLPPRGLAVGLLSLLSEAVGRPRRGRGLLCALTPEVVGLPTAPPLGWLGFPRPSALWDLITHGYFRTAAGRRDSPGLFVGGVGRHPAVPAVAGGGTGAALLRPMNPRRGF